MLVYQTEIYMELKMFVLAQFQIVFLRGK
jgi:hypothetical protein